jgi:hypothetical protein
VADDDFDSLLLVATVPRIMRVVINDVEVAVVEAVAILEVVRGMLSIDDCDEAVKITKNLFSHFKFHPTQSVTYFVVVAYDDSA